MALELGGKGIRNNLVAPGFIDTPTNFGVVEGAAPVRRMEGQALLGTADEVADAVVFLFGDGARFLNGSVVEVLEGLGEGVR